MTVNALLSLSLYTFHLYERVLKISQHRSYLANLHVSKSENGPVVKITVYLYFLFDKILARVSYLP